MRLTHVGLCVADARRSLAFYRDALDFRFARELEVKGEPSDTLLRLRDVRLRAIYLERDGFCIELLHYASPGHAGDGRPGSRAAGRVVAGPVRAAQRGSEAHRLEPRVAFDGEGELLGDLALEQVDLRAAGRERPESAVGDGGGRHAEPGLPVVGEHDVEADAVVRRTLGHAEQGRDAITGLDGVEDRAPEVGRRQLGRRGSRGPRQAASAREVLH